MLEKEIKILEINKSDICEKLESLGAEKTFDGFIHDIYYDFVEGENMKMEDNKRLFRVRQKGEIHLYTIKRKRNKKSEGGEDGVKIADEGESIITDVDSFKKVLEKYGMTQTREKKKYRTSYKFDNVEFDIDNYDGIPTLIEIEAKTLEEINKYIKVLGLENHIQKDFGSRKLYEYYGLDYSYL
ncbi:MAG: CYTH domain-containing protein [Candidatus Gracilibacteria bacterium]|nr:CYTH domain-containing protein [Candidatus Gracilibacteria bacterium]